MQDIQMFVMCSHIFPSYVNTLLQKYAKTKKNPERELHYFI